MPESESKRSYYLIRDLPHRVRMALEALAQVGFRIAADIRQSGNVAVIEGTLPVKRTGEAVPAEDLMKLARRALRRAGFTGKHIGQQFGTTKVVVWLPLSSDPRDDRFAELLAEQARTRNAIESLGARVPAMPMSQSGTLQPATDASPTFQSAVRGATAKRVGAMDQTEALAFDILVAELMRKARQGHNGKNLKRNDWIVIAQALDAEQRFQVKDYLRSKTAQKCLAHWNTCNSKSVTKQIHTFAALYDEGPITHEGKVSLPDGAALPHHQSPTGRKLQRFFAREFQKRCYDAYMVMKTVRE